MAEAAGLAPFNAVIGAVASATGDVQITGAPTGRVALGVEVADGTVAAGTESGTTTGTYTFSKSGTTASALVYFIL